MHERDLVPPETPARFLVQKRRPGASKLGQRSGHVGHLEGNVMQGRAPAGKEAGDTRLLIERCDQLDASLTEAQDGRLDPLGLEPLANLELGAEQAAMRLDRLAEVVDHHRDVMNRADLHLPDPTRRKADDYSETLTAWGVPTVSDA